MTPVLGFFSRDAPDIRLIIRPFLIGIGSDTEFGDTDIRLSKKQDMAWHFFLMDNTNVLLHLRVCEKYKDVLFAHNNLQ